MPYQSLKTPHVKDAMAYLVIGVAVVFFVLTLRPGHDWGGDFGLYIAHAKNIADGLPYSDTGFVYNARDPFMSPRSYPPVFPAFLAPVYGMFGLNLGAMKVANIMAFAIFLLLFHRYIGNRLDSRPARVLAIACMAFSPWFWEAKDRILPDFLFILVLYGTILLIDRMAGMMRAGASRYLAAFGGGVMIYLLYGTRSLGMLFVPALFLDDIIRRRTIRRTTLVVTVVFGVFYFAQNALLHTDQSYLESLATVENADQELVGRAGPDEPADDNFLSIIRNNLLVVGDRVPAKLYNYSRIMAGYWYVGENVIPGRVMFSLMSILAIAGFLNLILRSPSIGDYFILTYVLILLVVPFEQQRYMLPLVPLYILYIFRGIELVGQCAGRSGNAVVSNLAAALPFIVCLLAGASYASSYVLSDSTAIARGVESDESRELFAFVRENLPDDSLLVFHKPRPLALFTGKRATQYHWEPDLDRLWRELSGLGATHIVLPRYIDPAVHRDYYFPSIVERYRASLELLFENRDYAVYRMLNDDLRAADGSRQ